MSIARSTCSASSDSIKESWLALLQRHVRWVDSFLNRACLNSPDLWLYAINIRGSGAFSMLSSNRRGKVRFFATHRLRNPGLTTSGSVIQNWELSSIRAVVDALFLNCSTY
jgi:hypothetical protein